jgi:hypothetical protein
MMGVVALVGLPSALILDVRHRKVYWRNPTAAALVLSWAFGFLIYLKTGNGLALKFYFMADIAVIAAIYICKHEERNLRPYRNAWHQLQCFLLERSLWDRIVLCIFPLAWIAYIANIDAYYRYWTLWVLAVAQFLAAGGEALHSWIDGRKANASISPPEPPSSGLELCAVRGIGGYG